MYRFATFYFENFSNPDFLWFYESKKLDSTQSLQHFTRDLANLYNNLLIKKMIAIENISNDSSKKFLANIGAGIKNFFVAQKEEKALPEKPLLKTLLINNNNTNTTMYIDQSTPNHHPEPTVMFTTDKKYLDQYYALRHVICKDENGWESYNGSENECDKIGKLVLLFDDKLQVKGGARLMISGDRKYLYSEIPDSDYTYNNVFNKIGLELEGCNYSEISSFVVDKTYRDRRGTEKMLQLMIEESLKNNCKYIVGISSIVRCRNYRIAFKKLGYDLEIVKDFLWTKRDIYNNVETFLMAVRIK